MVGLISFQFCLRRHRTQRLCSPKHRLIRLDNSDALQTYASTVSGIKGHLPQESQQTGSREARLQQAVQAASRHTRPHQRRRSQPYATGKIGSLKGGIWLSACCGPQTEQVILVSHAEHDDRLSQLPPALVFDPDAESPDNPVNSICPS